MTRITQQQLDNELRKQFLNRSLDSFEKHFDNLVSKVDPSSRYSAHLYEVRGLMLGAYLAGAEAEAEHLSKAK